MAAGRQGDAQCMGKAVVVGVPVLLPLVAVPCFDAHGDHAFGDRGRNPAGRRIGIRHGVASLPEHRAPFVVVDPVGGLVLHAFAVVVDLAGGPKPMVEDQDAVAIHVAVGGVELVVLEHEPGEEEIVAAEGGDQVPPQVLEGDVGPHEGVEPFLRNVLGLHDLGHRDGEDGEHHRGDHSCDQQFDDREARSMSSRRPHDSSSSS